jgi:hypothetical protein
MTDGFEGLYRPYPRFLLSNIEETRAISGFDPVRLFMADIL